MSLNDRLALAAIRGVVAELGAAEVLSLLFGAAAPAPAVRAAAPPPPAPEVGAGDRSGSDAGEAAELIEQLVARHGTLRDASKACGVHEQQLRRYRAGKAPTASVLERLRAGMDADGSPARTNAPKRPGPRPRPPKAQAGGEHMELIEQLVARHGAVTAAAEAAGVGAAVFRRWRAGKAVPAQGGLEKLRAAATGGKKRATKRRRPRADEDAGDDDVQLAPTTEAQGYVLELTERYGDLASVAAATGFGVEHLTRWNAGGPTTPRALERLREAAHAPRGSRDGEVQARRREAQEASDAPSPGAGAGGAGAEEDGAEEAA